MNLAGSLLALSQYENEKKSLDEAVKQFKEKDAMNKASELIKETKPKNSRRNK